MLNIETALGHTTLTPEEIKELAENVRLINAYLDQNPTVRLKIGQDGNLEAIQL